MQCTMDILYKTFLFKVVNVFFESFDFELNCLDSATCMKSIHPFVTVFEGAIAVNSGHLSIK